MTLPILLQGCFDGLMIGGVYAAAAVGLSLCFGVMRMVNFAHGDLLMAFMFLAYYVVTMLGIDPYIGLFITVILSFIIGYFLQKTIFNTLIMREKERDPISVLLFTSGLSVFLMNLAMILFGTLPKMADSPYNGQTFKIATYIISVPKFISFIIATVITIALWILLQKSDLGRAIRATSQNRQVAKLMGINERKIYCIAMAISMAMAGVAAALLITFIPVGYNTGATFGMKSFVIVVLGGIGSVPGCLVGGIIIGLVEKIAGVLLTDTYATCIVFAVFVLMLIVKPSGLFGKERG